MKDSKQLNSKASYKHFSMLRKAIVVKKSGVIRYHMGDNSVGELFLDRGGIDCRNDSKQLIQFLSSPMLMVEWDAREVKFNGTPAVEALEKALDKIVWSEAELHAISVMFSKLPRVRVTLIDIHFENFLTDISYNLFYQQSLSIEGFTPAYFLLNNDVSNSLLFHRVRILAFNYIVGTMTQVESEKRENISKDLKKNKRFGFINRIINRIRGI